VFWKFLGALLRQWISIAGGATVSVGLLIWQAVADADIPGWMYTLVAVGTFIGSAFEAWKAESVRADRAQAKLDAADTHTPSAVLRPMVAGHLLLVEVRNDGADGVFRATIETDGGGTREA
jgi:hypothetical protein